MSESNKNKDSYKEEIDALKAELKRLKAKEDINNFKEEKIFCSKCNAEVRLGSKYCAKCGTVIGQNKSSNEMASKDRLNSSKSSKVNDSLEVSALKSKRLSAGLCGILLGGFGVHKFILGYNQQGYIYLGAFIGTFCFGGFLLVSILALVEGIIYLSMPIEQFKKTYIENKKEWF
tara:strand:+ start:1396 stop:1920 length:525 start_codon:yes stop_codon:yes gene_type:complete